MAIDTQTLRGRRNTDRWNRISMGDLFERVKWAAPDRVVLRCWTGAYENAPNAALTAGSADEQANRYANALRARGIREGQIVMMICENSAEAVLAKIGMAKAGVTIAPLNPNLGNDVIEQLIDLCKPAGLVADSDFLEKALPIADKVCVPVLHQIRLAARDSDLPTFADFIAAAPALEPEVEIHGDDIWELLFTSGSTAVPKGVMVSHANTMFSALSFNGLGMIGLDYESDFVICSFLPMIYHVGDGLLYNAVMSGGCALIGRKFIPRATAEAMSQHKVTCLWGGAPQAIDAIAAEFAKDPALCADSLRSVIFGWAPMNPQVYQRARQHLGAKTKYIEIIGQTEVVCAHRFWLEKHNELYLRTSPLENYVGEPHGLLAAAIAGEAGTVLPPGDTRVGEAMYRSPALMAGYFKKDDDTREAFRDGWFHGGDAFRWGEENQRILADRFKDIVKSGGENVTCIRVEAAISTHPAVLKTAVVGLPHRRWGEAVTAFVVLRPSQSVAVDELHAIARAKLAPFEVPKEIRIIEALPETVGGKVQKHILRKSFSGLFEVKTDA